MMTNSIYNMVVTQKTKTDTHTRVQNLVSFGECSGGQIWVENEAESIYGTFVEGANAVEVV